MDGRGWVQRRAEMAEAEEATITNGSIRAGEGTRGMGRGRSVDMGGEWGA